MFKQIWRKYKSLVVVLLALTAAWALAPQALDLPLLLDRFASARPGPLLLVVALQALRYFGTGLLMSLFARSLGFRAAPLTASLVALASGAASKLVPVAGAGGIAVRCAYLKRCGVDDAAIGGYFVLQNVLVAALERLDGGISWTR